VNEVFLKVEKTYESFDKPQIAVKPSPDSRFTTTLEEELSINNIVKIVKSFAGNKDKIIDELSKLPLDQLKSDKDNPYYCKLAIEKKNESKKSYVSPEKIVAALSNLKNERKKANPFYKAKKEYNLRNNLDWKGRPKNAG
jgi:hypothetical protein